MDAYIYKAALYCEECAEQIIQGIFEKHGVDVGCRPPEDSEQWPQGPYANGGGESDSPEHCDCCGVFLENSLTSDGEEYVRAEVAKAVREEGYIECQVWAPFYGIELP